MPKNFTLDSLFFAYDYKNIGLKIEFNGYMMVGKTIPKYTQRFTNLHLLMEF